MPDSMGKRKRRDVTARKHAAREERRVARADDVLARRLRRPDDAVRDRHLAGEVRRLHRPLEGEAEVRAQLAPLVVEHLGVLAIDVQVE